MWNKSGLLVDRKLGVVLCLNGPRYFSEALSLRSSVYELINDAVDYTEGVEVKRVARHATVSNLQVLVVEVIEERRTVVPAVRLCKEIEVAWGANLGIKLGDGIEERLKYVLRIHVISRRFHVVWEYPLTHVATAARSVVSILPVLSGSKSGYLPVAGHSVEL